MAMLARTGVPASRLRLDGRCGQGRTGLSATGPISSRPDGHVALASAGQDPALFGQFIADLGITPRRDIG